MVAVARLIVSHGNSVAPVIIAGLRVLLRDMKGALIVARSSHSAKELPSEATIDRPYETNSMFLPVPVAVPRWHQVTSRLTRRSVSNGKGAPMRRNRAQGSQQFSWLQGNRWGNLRLLPQADQSFKP